MNEANSQVREELKRYTCPFQSYCGTQDLMTIVPTFNEENREFKNSDKKGEEFQNGMLCRHQIKFPMDANYGDKILF